MQDFVYPYRNGAKPVATGMFFPQTKHYVGGGFWSFWNTRGGLAIFGYLLTEEIQEKCEDGQTQTVQYFERARFEYWPKNPVASQVQLSRLGADALARKK